MKNYLKFGFLAILAMIAFSACEEDPLGGGGGNPGGGGNTNPEDPTIVTVVETGFVDFAATVNPGTVFSVKLIADPGDDPLKALTITENGVNVDPSRITIDGGAAAANPVLIVGDATTQGFETQIDIVAQDVEGVSTFGFILLDDANKTVSTSVEITVMSDVMITPPSIVLEGSGMSMVAPGTILTIPVSVADVTSPLNTIAVLEDGVYIEAERLWYDDLTIQFPSNPALVPDGDREGLMRTIYVRAHDGPGLKTYTLELTDESMGTYTRDFTIETGSTITTLEGILFNRAGPSGTGGLDLDAGVGTGSSDADAEIKDEGIDGGPLASNWIRRISGVNGVVVKHLFRGQNGLPDNYEFANVTTSEQIDALWVNGFDFVDTNTAGDLVSIKVEVGDEFIVQKGSKHYLIKVTQINETMDDNGDNYVIDIKH